MHDTPAYGLWTLVIINSVFFIFFAASFSGLRWDKDWRSLGPYSAFIVALFTEMYGFPLTIYLLSGWLGQRLPGVDLWSHDSGHLWSTVFGLKGDPHWSILHLASAAVIGAGFWLLAASWKRLFDAQKRGIVATLGPYARVRHPQYVAFVLVMFGFLLQWPTLLTLAMFPVLTWMYVSLARSEEKDAIASFGDAYRAYASDVPGFIPKLSRMLGGAPKETHNGR